MKLANIGDLYLPSIFNGCRAIIGKPLIGCWLIRRIEGERRAKGIRNYSKCVEVIHQQPKPEMARLRHDPDYNKRNLGYGNIV